MDREDNDDDGEEEDEHHDSGGRDDIEVSLRKYNATMQNILIVMIKILRIGISIIIKKTWPNIVNIFDAKRAKKYVRQL